MIQEPSNNKINFYVGEAFKNDSRFLDFIADQYKENLYPFSEDAVNFVNDFAKSILLDRNARIFPELIVMANFFKKQTIKSEITKHHESSNNCIYKPLGSTFHIAPSNVDTIFLYSSLIALLCGNYCFIRISEKINPQVTFALEKLNKILLKNKKFKKRLIIFNYDHNKHITDRISESVDARIIWGGDESVFRIRKSPLSPLARDIAFPNRFSFSIINSKRVNESLDYLPELTNLFIKDTIIFSQQACSSPRSVVWVGSKKDNHAARNRFWKEYEMQIKSVDHENSEGMVMDRFVATSFFSSLNLGALTSSYTEVGSKMDVFSLDSPHFRTHHPGNGLFLELELKSLKQLSSFLNSKDQTISHYGFSQASLELFIKSIQNRSIDRVLPIGKALSFTSVWDGYDLYEVFTRKVLLSN